MDDADGDWRPWIKTELEKLNFEVHIPQMPDIDTPIIEAWVNKLLEVTGTPDKDTYFIGHSIGCQTILRYLETINSPVGGAVFVAGWFNLENLEDEETKETAKPWIEVPLNLEKVKSILTKSTLLISDNDPFGCFEENKEKFSKIGSKEIIVPNGKHLTTEDGYEEFPLLLNEIIKLTN